MKHSADCVLTARTVPKTIAARGCRANTAATCSSQSGSIGAVIVKVCHDFARGNPEPFVPCQGSVLLYLAIVAQLWQSMPVSGYEISGLSPAALVDDDHVPVGIDHFGQTGQAAADIVWAVAGWNNHGDVRRGIHMCLLNSSQWCALPAVTLATCHQIGSAIGARVPPLATFRNSWLEAWRGDSPAGCTTQSKRRVIICYRRSSPCTAAVP